MRKEKNRLCFYDIYDTDINHNPIKNTEYDNKRKE